MFFFFQAEDGIRDRSPSRGLGDVYKRQVQDSAVYMSTGATAEELAVFQASSTVDAQGILADMKKRRDSQLQMYLDYKSSEAARLDDAVLYVHDTFVVYMVSDDSETAQGIISDYLE